ncbi:MAG: SRPBCC family protein [Sphingomonas sp.]|nr:SRPBCC family protein [Sphingomonas sp.]
MSESPTVHGNFTIDRHYDVAPARVFAAFADPAKKKSWFAASDTHEITAFDSDFRIGGIEKLHYRFGENTPFPGAQLTNDGYYHDIVPERRIVTSSHMAIAGRPISVALVTIELTPSGEGTDVSCTFQGAFFEGSDGAVMRRGGWETLLDRLALSV